MDISAVGLGAIIVLVFLFLQIPVFASLLAGSVTYFMLTPNIPTQIIAQRVISGIESIPLLAVPFFVCAGVFMNYSGVTKRVMEFCEILMGRTSGGLAQVNVLLSTLMGGLSGSNLADAAMQAKMLVPEMEKKGFSKEFSSVVTASSAMITPLIPPGIAMIIYGSIANVSIGRLFIAGIGPGILLCVSMMILVSVISKKRGYKPARETRVTPKELISGLGTAALPLFLPVIIIGGIRLGIFTPTEAGAVAIIYSLILGAVYREMKFSHIITGLKETITSTASIMLIVGAASAFAWVLTREQIPQQMTGLIVSMISNKYVFLIAVNIFLIFVGMFIEGNAAMIVLVPLLAPVAVEYGVNEIQFAMIFIFNMAVGCLTPPMGTLMFVTCGITKCKIKNFIKEAIPFYILLLICLMLLTFVPVFSTGLVDLIY
ncbi:TRAP dicarboxylate transporter, DctM subunit [Alkaliphilus metalliredigens QYMF]|uniref:TRAP dicarboxylate transporter, DctM subunit n=1 Tax=Alkaliphilus metalliredigens (strain QYMF) TaxID=293826 RepID=A6TKR1_ALKMQ|nr:TRAP transporter large permease [Alkaliphilus metalliredigens]ABR46779.1 TRAP dicarboxylate transporter, DctM subunit [Alkaliphilus metalliredigens QYMF]